MKKQLAVGVLTLSLAVMPMCAWAEDVMVISAPETTQSEVSTMQKFEQAYGTIVSINDVNGTMQVEVETDDGTIIFNCSAETWIVDAKGQPLDLNDRVSDKVMVYHKAIMTRSLPPQSPAIAIIGNITDDDYMMYAVVEEVINNDDGSIIVVTNEGSRHVTINKKTALSPFKTKNIVGIEDITVGSEILLGYRIMTLSLPAHATAERVVLLSAAPAANETEVTLEAMLPLRANAEQLGYSVEWNDGLITLTKGETVVKFNVGAASVEQNGQTVELSQATELRNGVTYVPQGLLDMLSK